MTLRLANGAGITQIVIRQQVYSFQPDRKQPQANMQFTATCVILWTLFTVTCSRARDRSDDTHETRSQRDLHVQRDHVFPSRARVVRATNDSSQHVGNAKSETGVDYDTLHVNASENSELPELDPAGTGWSPGDRLFPEDEEDWEVLTEQQYADRMRAKNLRVFLIQAEILRELGMKKQPNITGIHISQRKAEMAIQKFMKPGPVDEQDTDLAHRYHFTLPSCDLPHKTHRSWRDPAYFRLYFVPPPLETHPLLEFRMASTMLRLYKKGPPDDCSCETTEAPTPRPRSVPRRNTRGSGREGTMARSQSTREHARRRSDRSRRKHNSSRRNLDRHRAHTPDPEEKTKQLRVTVNSFKKPIKKNKTVRKQISASVMVDRDYVGWVEVDIKQLVRRWMKRPSKNYGIEIYVEDDELNSVDPYSVFDDINCTTSSHSDDVLYVGAQSLQADGLFNETMQEGGFNLTLPNLETTLVEVASSAGRRKRRHTALDDTALGNTEEAGEATCVKETSYVSFEELSLSNWIVAPLGIESSYCRGHCNSNHIKQRAGNTRNNKTKQYRCCGPTKWETFTFLHLAESDTLAVSSLNNFLISQCGCRE